METEQVHKGTSGEQETGIGTSSFSSSSFWRLSRGKRGTFGDQKQNLHSLCFKLMETEQGHKGELR